MWQALLSMFGGAASSGGEGTKTAQGEDVGGGTSQVPIFGQATGASDRMQAKFESGSAERDALLRQSLMAAPTADLGFADLSGQVVGGGATQVGAGSGTNLGMKGEGEGIDFMGFLKGLFQEDENDTAIPEEAEQRLERETSAEARQASRAADRADPKASVDFYAEMQKLFSNSQESAPVFRNPE